MSTALRRGEHFGELLRDLRIARRLSQQRLAELAGLEEAVILAAEKSIECSLRRTQITAVVTALESVLPLDEESERAIVRCGRVGGLVEELVELSHRERGQIGESLRNQRATEVAAACETATSVLRRYREAAAFAATSEDPLAFPGTLACAEATVETLRRFGQMLGDFAHAFGDGAFLSLVQSIDGLTLADACFFRALAGGRGA